MAIETERKFLVCGDFKKDAIRKIRIRQGYLCSAPERTVRIRTSDEKGFITIKGKSNEHGLSRYEWEKEIPYSDALELMALCEPGAIDKTRFLVPCGTHVFEVDEFHGQNEGLIVAEIELISKNEPFTKPNWLGNEVTEDIRYYNAMLTKKPFKTWLDH